MRDASKSDARRSVDRSTHDGRSQAIQVASSRRVHVAWGQVGGSSSIDHWYRRSS